MDSISQTYILLEVFNNPYEMTDVTRFVAPSIQSGYTGISNVKAHSFNHSNDMLVSWHKDGAMEIHHFPGTIEGLGHMIGQTPNPRFVASAMSLGKEHLDAGGKVRIITSQHSLPSFKSLGEKVAKRQGWNIEQSDGPIKDQEFYGAQHFPGIVLHSLEVSKK